jgi:hypothetical protein
VDELKRANAALSQMLLPPTKKSAVISMVVSNRVMASVTDVAANAYATNKMKLSMKNDLGFQRRAPRLPTRATWLSMAKVTAMKTVGTPGVSVEKVVSINRVILPFAADNNDNYPLLLLDSDEGGLMVMCETCKVWQHTQCMEIAEDEVPEHYYCEICEPSLHTELLKYVRSPLVGSRTTAHPCPQKTGKATAPPTPAFISHKNHSKANLSLSLPTHYDYQDGE